MLPALYIPALVSPLCPGLPLPFSSATAKQTAREIPSPPRVCSTIPFPLPIPFPFPFPLPFPSSVAFPFPFPSFVPCPFPVHFSLPCMPSSPSWSSLSLPSPGRLRPALGAPESAQFSSSSSPPMISFQFSCLTARKLPGSYRWQLGGSICALRSSLVYKENHSMLHLSSRELVVCRLELSTRSLKAQGLSHLQMVIWSQVLLNICPIYERKAAHHSWKHELLLLWCSHISWNCETWWVVIGTRIIISWKRSHALWTLTPQHCISIWHHGCVPRWIPLYGPNPTTSLDS